MVGRLEQSFQLKLKGENKMDNQTDMRAFGVGLENEKFKMSDLAICYHCADEILVKKSAVTGYETVTYPHGKKDRCYSYYCAQWAKNEVLDR